MEPIVFGEEESARWRGEVLGRLVGSSDVPAPLASLEAVQHDSADPVHDRRHQPPSRVNAGADDQVTALERARDLQQACGVFTFVPEEPEPPRPGARGALEGVPVAVKDNIAVAGMPWSAGSALLAGEIADRDAPVVESLRAAGAWVVGKAALDEFAFGTVGPGVTNPAAPGLTVGGSSGGSAAAVAGGACPVSIGTDTGGSVRIPASCTGVVGFKPTPGWVSTRDVVPLSWSLDTVGVFATTVDDALVTYDALAEPGPPRTVEHRPLGGLRIAVPDAHYLRVATTNVRRSFAEACDALAGLVAAVQEVALPDSDDSLHVQYLVVLAESASYHRGRWGSEAVGYTEGVRSALERGDAVDAAAYLAAQRARTAMRREVLAHFATHDVLVLPTMAIDPPEVGAEEVALGDGRVEDTISAMLRYTALFNHVGLPAISLPLPSSDGVPRGLQLVGRPGADRELLDVAGSVAAAIAG